MMVLLCGYDCGYDYGFINRGVGDDGDDEDGETNGHGNDKNAGDADGSNNDGNDICWFVRNFQRLIGWIVTVFDLEQVYAPWDGDQPIASCFTHSI